jgi:hypothetical protein
MLVLLKEINNEYLRRYRISKKDKFFADGF